MKIGIINYSLGNVGSVYSAFKFCKYDVILVGKHRDLKNVNMIVLAGVGNFITATSRLKELQLWDSINEEVLEKKKPVLGICLGMQLFADFGYEGGETRGFGWIKGKVVKMDSDHLRIPHMGWNEVEGISNLFNGINKRYFYFMHSYHFIPVEEKVAAATTIYGGKKIISAVRQDNIIGVQFHPEKSQGDGLRLLRNIVEDIT